MKEEKYINLYQVSIFKNQKYDPYQNYNFQ